MTEEHYGPTSDLSKALHAMKYRGERESFKQAMARIANTLSDDDDHFDAFFHILLNMRFLPAGRVQSDIGSPRQVTAFNCFVSRTIEDSMDGIMDAAKEAAATMRLGGGIGFDFSPIRPRGALIKSLGSASSGVVSFMEIFNAVCGTIASAGDRRGAMMGVLRVDHPDIEEFIEAKTKPGVLTNFNVSVGVTDEFMEAVISDDTFDLRFKGAVYSTVNARYLWDKIMRATWDWAEPGILFIDRINKMNNLYYCETIASTNPCGEVPLPPYGACLLGSFNLTKYVTSEGFDADLFVDDIIEVTRAMDNVIDNTGYPLEEQRLEAESKRRMGLGVTGVANAGEMLGFGYGSTEFCEWLDEVMGTLANSAYQTSALLAKEKGPFPLFERENYFRSRYLEVLGDHTLSMIAKHGIRNSHLLSFAPTGTISLCADNVSSGIEPVFSEWQERVIIMDGGPVVKSVKDWGYAHGIKGKTTNQCTVDDHLRVLNVASKWSDSAVSKTVTVGSNTSWSDFKDVYMRAYKAGCKGCTTFRPDGKRFGVMKAKDEDGESEGAACYIDPDTGSKTCE